MASSSPPTRTARLVLCFLLVVDKAFREYAAAGSALDAYVRSANKLSLYIEGVGRYETCIHCVVRALRLVDRIGRSIDAPQLDREVRAQLKKRLESLRELRNETEHMDEHISGGQLADGEAHALSVAEDGNTLEIASYQVTFTELADALRQLHSVAMEIIGGLPAPANK
jgi:hypothetical protein